MQILGADLNDELERHMSDLVAILPRASSDAERVEALTQSLGHDLERIEGRLSVLEGSTSQHVLVLERLDLLKRNMETCALTLTEAASWSALVRDVHASFASSALGRVAAQLEAMQRSARVLRDVPGSVERSKTLQQFTDQLEVVRCGGVASPEHCPFFPMLSPFPAGILNWMNWCSFARRYCGHSSWRLSPSLRGNCCHLSTCEEALRGPSPLSPPPSPPS